MAIRDIWVLQFFLGRRDFKRAEKTLEHSRFRAGYDFLLLREVAGEVDPSLAKFWTEYQFLPLNQRREMAAEFREKRPRRRRKKKPSSPPPVDDQAS